MYPISNIVAGSLLAAAMVFVSIVAIGARMTTATGGDRVWAGVGGVLAIFGFVVGLAVLGSGINALRPVVLDNSYLRLPIFKITRGFGHLSIPLDDVAGVELTYRSAPRDGRWRLMVIRLHHDNAYCDSLSSARSRDRGVSGTAAERGIAELRRALPNDRLARWDLP